MKFEPGVGAKLVRNENFYKASWFDECRDACIPDVAARTAALTAGEIHCMDRCDLKTLDLVKATPGVKIDEVTGYGHYVIPMNVTSRRSTTSMSALALKYAIDRKAIVDKVFSATARRATTIRSRRPSSSPSIRSRGTITIRRRQSPT